MKIKSKEFCLEVWGDLACFTQPTSKVDRVSYDVITPSAAKSIVGCIFDKPAINNVITKIAVMNPITKLQMKTNEIKGGLLKINKCSPIYINEYHRNQRQNIILTNVCYRIYFRQEFIPIEERGIQSRESGTDETPQKYVEMFLRRARKGQLFKSPYFGIREYSANYKLIETPDFKKPINITENFGIMFYGYADYTKAPRGKQWFDCQMTNGTIITDPDTIEIYKS